MKISCGIFANIAPLYVKPLWYELSASSQINYSFYSSDEGYSGIKTIDKKESKWINPDASLDWNFLRNITINNRIVFQRGIISKCISTNYDVYVLYGEMHCLSNWIAGLVCKIRKKPFVFWGHGFYGNEKGIKKRIRLLFNSLSDISFVYGNISRNLMIEMGFNPTKVITVYNSLDYKLHKRIFEEKGENDLQELRLKLFKSRSHLPVILFIGRLTREKKVSYLIESVCQSRLRGNDFNCLIVGDGEESEYLKDLTLQRGISDSVRFYGASYDENMNARLIMLSDCCVSPGNVGLTAIHSLSLGTPVITHDNLFNQGPEVEAIIHNKTGLLFKENNIKELSLSIDNLLLNRLKGVMSDFCINEVKENWNPKKQADIIENAIINLIQIKKDDIRA